MAVDLDANEIIFGSMDDFDDPLNDDSQPPGSRVAFGALASAAAANAAEGGGG